ncbi:hypothetical protein EDD16DRAFT_766572 [Pisolithus croceorrhizus]|nr:hypothetical protein EDD16DRAFT_766572 [Pisolithus croceorrhizus]
MEGLGAQQKDYLSKRIGSLARRGVLADWGCAVPINHSEHHPSAGYVAAPVAPSSSSVTVNNSEIVDDPFNPAIPPTEPVANIPDPDTKSANHVTVVGKGLPDLARALIPILKLSASDEIVVLTGDSNPEGDRRRTTDGGPQYRTGTWSWMSAALIMADPGRPVTREPHHDLESFFYILVSICVLLDEPFKYKSDDELSWSFHECFNIPEPNAFKTVATQSNFGWFSKSFYH